MSVVSVTCNIQVLRTLLFKFIKLELIYKYVKEIKLRYEAISLFS